MLRDRLSKRATVAANDDLFVVLSRPAAPPIASSASECPPDTALNVTVLFRLQPEVSLTVATQVETLVTARDNTVATAN